MDFFSHQDRARSSTRKLVILFICAVAVLIAITSIIVCAILFYGDQQAGIDAEFFRSDIFLQVSLVVIAVVLLGSFYRLAQLRAGGKAVAEAMGGRLLNINTQDADERKILNVVEEMAIAAGLPVPPVYLIEDPAINAFAAGFQKEDAVIGITRGCIHELSRDELQGVVAHEFSHIFNGDMRLNIRLIGWLYGILIIGLIGYMLLRGGVYSSAGFQSRGRRGNGNAIVLLGLGLIVVGYGGTFFGNMIKAAVSRQREFLADASAVQFTRNPEGISGALKKIGNYAPGSHIQSADASEISHMLFSEGLKASFTGLFATHPPLSERIRRLEPGWEGDVSAGPTGSARAHPGAAGFSGAAGLSAVDSIGNPGTAHIQLADQRLAAIPSGPREDVHDSLGASLVIYALLIELTTEPDVAERQLDLLREGLSPHSFESLLRTREQLKDLPREFYLPLVELALPALKQLSKVQYRTFMSFLSQLMVADQTISLFEWCLFKILRHNLDGRRRNGGMAVTIGKSAHAIEVLLTTLADAGHEDEEAARRAFNEAADYLNLSLEFNREYIHNTEELEAAMNLLKRLKPLQKPMLLKSMAKSINADGVVSPAESEVLRAVGDVLDCPIPPLLPDQKFI